MSFKTEQVLSVLLPIARTFASSTKLIPVAGRSEQLQMSTRSALYKRKRMGESGQPWRTPCSDKK
jgi:hypothetical protein